MLDHDVDAAVGKMLRSERHTVTTASGHSMHDAGDDELTVLADQMKAVLVTHDKEFTNRRRANAIGWHVRLDCQEPDAAEILKAHLDAVVNAVNGREHCVVVVSRARCKVSGEWN